MFGRNAQPDADSAGDEHEESEMAKRMGQNMSWGNSTGRAFLLASSLCIASTSLALSGCRITDDDVAAWARKSAGPRKLVAVLQHDKYPTALRVNAAVTLVTMKPRGGRAVGLLGSDEYIGLLEGLAEMDVSQRTPIIAGMVPKLVEGMALVPQGDEVDESVPYKDAAYALLTHNDAGLVSEEADRKALTDALVSWCQQNFVARMDDTTQLYGVEQVLRFVKAPGVKGLTPLIAADFKKIRELSQLIFELGDEATKLDASKRMVTVAEYVDSPAWIKQKEPTVDAANKASGLNVKPNQFEKQLEAYQEEELLRLFGAMKNIGKKPIVDYLLAYATEKKNPEKRRAAALAGLENNLDRKNAAQAKVILDLLASDDTPDLIRDVASRRVGELSREQVAERLYSLFDHDRWKLRWTVAGLLLRMTDGKTIDEFMSKLGKIKHMAITEPLTYGPLLKGIKGNTDALVSKYARAGEPAPVRLSALGYYYEYGSKADLAKVEPFISDTQKVPSCAKDAEQCAWSCSVAGKDGPELKEVSTLGNFVEYCLIPAMKVRDPVDQKLVEETSAGAKDAPGKEPK